MEPAVQKLPLPVVDVTIGWCRLWEKALHAEVEWTVGPIPIEDKKGKEVVLRYASSLNSGRTKDRVPCAIVMHHGLKHHVMCMVAPPIVQHCIQPIAYSCCCWCQWCCKW